MYWQATGNKRVQFTAFWVPDVKINQTFSTHSLWNKGVFGQFSESKHRRLLKQLEQTIGRSWEVNVELRIIVFLNFSFLEFEKFLKRKIDN